jgi:hypothetical protein
MAPVGEIAVTRKRYRFGVPGAHQETADFPRPNVMRCRCRRRP